MVVNEGPLAHFAVNKLDGTELIGPNDLRKKLDAFRQKTERRMVKYWNDPGDLKGQVALAIIQIRKSHPAEGWIRASEAMTPDVKTQSSLSSEPRSEN